MTTLKTVYKLIEIIDGDCYVLGDKSGYGRNVQLYDELHENLKVYWEKRDRSAQLFTVGEHVAVKSVKVSGIRRGRVQEVRQVSGETRYRVFLYDEGVSEEVSTSRISCLDKTLIKVKPRTTTVRVPGLVPIKKIVDIANSPEAGPLVYIYTQDSHWGTVSNNIIREWMTAPNVRYIGYQKLQTSKDGSTLGLVYRKVRPVVAVESGEPVTESPIDPKEKEFLVDFLVSTNIGKVCIDRRNMQMGITPIVEATEVKVEPPKVEVTRKVPAQQKCEHVNREKYVRSAVASTSLSSTYCDYEGPLNLLDSTERVDQIKLNVPGRLLVRGRNLRSGYTSMTDFKINPLLEKGLNSLQIKELSDYHKAVTPNFLRFMDIIGVCADSGGTRGKNMRALAYLIPIIGIVYDKYNTTDYVSNEEPPETVIVVNSFNYGRELLEFIEQLLGFCKHLNMRTHFITRDGEKSKETMGKTHYKSRMVRGGISILITTVDYLSHVLTTPDGPFLFSGLKFLVFEELDEYVCSHYNDITTFLTAAIQNMEISKCQVPFQIMMSAAKWEFQMESLYKLITRDMVPMIAIFAPNQVMRFAQPIWMMEYIQNEEERYKGLQRILKEHIRTHRHIVVTCSTDAVAREAYKFLEIAEARFELVTTDADYEDLAGVVSRWTQSRSFPSVMIVSDAVRSNLGISDATCLIAFDKPIDIPRRSLIAERFSYVWANIRHIATDDFPAKPSEKAPIVYHFFFSGKESNFFSVYKFINPMPDCHIPPQLHEIASSMKSVELRGAPFCNQLRLFGVCVKENCTLRHSFTDAELSNTSIPCPCELEVEVLGAENPSLYEVSLRCAYNYVRGKRVKTFDYIAELKSRSEELQNYFSRKENCTNLEDYAEGAWCALIHPDGSFVRAKIAKILYRDKADKVVSIRVLCVDTGDKLNPNASDCYQLPEIFQKYPALTIELVLCNLKPCRGESVYRASNVKRANALVKTVERAPKTFTCKVWVATSDTIFVNPMVEYAIDEMTNVHYRLSSLRRQLIFDGAAQFNPSHLDVIRNLAGAGEEKVEEELDEDNEFPFAEEFGAPLEVVEFAHINLNESVTLVSQYGYDPGLFFCVIAKNWDIRENLQKELHEYVVKCSKDPKFSEPYSRYFQVGLPVAAKEPVDGIYNRGLIVDVRSCATGPTEYKVFFVDFGDTWWLKSEKLFFLPKRFIGRLPFQIIALSLDHIMPLEGHDVWGEDRESFLDMILPDDAGQNLDVIAYERIPTSEMNGLPNGIRYYKAVVQKQNLYVADELVKQGLAEYVTGRDNLSKDLFERDMATIRRQVNDSLRESPDDEDVIEGEYDVMPMEDMDGIGSFDVYLGDLATRMLSENFNPAICAPSTVQQTSSIEQSGAVQQKKVVLLPSDGFRHPKVVWRQDDDVVFLTILVPDIKEYSLVVSNDKYFVEFQVNDDRGYGFTLKFFGKVNPEFTATLTGQCIRVKFRKLIGSRRWPRITFEKGAKPNWLSDDLDGIEEEIEDEYEAGMPCVDEVGQTELSGDEGQLFSDGDDVVNVSSDDDDDDDY